MSVDAFAANNENEPVTFEMIGDTDAPQCVDGVCEIPEVLPVDSTAQDSGSQPTHQRPRPSDFA